MQDRFDMNKEAYHKETDDLLEKYGTIDSRQVQPEERPERKEKDESDREKKP